MKRNLYRRGSSLPETVIVMAVLMFLLLGIIDFGRALYTYSFVAQLARQGARWIIVRGTSCTQLTVCNATDANLLTYVQSLNEGATSNSGLTAIATATPSSCGTNGQPPFAVGCTVTVTVGYHFYFMFPFLPSAGINMSSSSTMQQAN